MHTPSALCFGLITDIQHADKDTVTFEGRPQRYRESKGKLQEALTDFVSRPEQQFVLTLGDIIDGCDPATDNADMQMIAGMFDTTLPGRPVYHVLGNHCLAASRAKLLKALHMPGSYYTTHLGSNWRLIVLDTTEMSLHSKLPQDSSAMQQAKAWAATHPLQQHPNAHAWNGGCSSQQLEWLQQQLAAAAEKQEQVIVACHHPVAPGSAPDEYLAWGYEQLLQLLCGAASTVRLVLSGHYHPGGYCLHQGVHFVVFEGVLEAPADSNAYGHVVICDSTVNITGCGVATSRVLQL